MYVCRLIYVVSMYIHIYIYTYYVSKSLESGNVLYILTQLSL